MKILSDNIVEEKQHFPLSITTRVEMNSYSSFTCPFSRKCLQTRIGYIGGHEVHRFSGKSEISRGEP